MIKYDGKIVQSVPLAITEKTSTYNGELKVSKLGSYEVIVYAYDAATGNTGVDKTTFVIIE